MVRVGGASVASSSGQTMRRLSNLLTGLMAAAVSFAMPDRRRSQHRDAYLPHRFPKLGGRYGGQRRNHRKISFACMAVVMLVTFAILQWYLLSFLVIGKHAPKATDDNSNNEIDYNDPVWTTCPANDEDTTESSSNAEDICFLTCIFGDTVQDVDQPANVEWFNRYWCHTRFYLVTNLPDLPAPGWITIVANSTTATDPLEKNHTAIKASASATTTQQKNIVTSRHAKFLAWEALPEIVPKQCAAVVYMDGYLAPIRYQSWWSLAWALVGNPPWSPASPLFPGGWISWSSPPQRRIPPPIKFQTVVKQVRYHPWGLSQVKQKYFDGLSMTTLLNNLVRDRKDTREHVETTLAWFRNQADFEEILPYYLNKYFAYDPNNARYRELSSSFWKTYTTYGGLWRDQPLWAYFLHRFNVTPAVMTTEGIITKGGDLFQTRGKLGWGKHIYT